MDKGSFSAGMGMLNARFGGQRNAEIIRIYYNFLGLELDNRQWQVACQQAVVQETFFPSPARLLELAGKGGRFEGEQLWNAILKRVERGERVRGTVSEWAYAALEHIGGVKTLEASTPESLPFRRRDYVDAYVALVQQNSAARMAATLPLPASNAEIELVLEAEVLP